MTLIDIGLSRHAQRGTAFGRLGAKVFRVAAELRRRRHMTISLGALSSRQLRDIGLMASDLESACQNPLSRDAAAELRQKAALRTGNW